MLLLLPVCKTEGQNIAVKSDLLTGMLSSPNLGVEVRLSERFTLETRISLQPFPGRREQTLEALVCTAGTALLDVPALRRAFLRGEPDVRSVQCGKNETAFGALQGSALRQIRRKCHGCGLLVRLPLYPLSALGTGNKPRHRISAHRIRTLPLPALRRKDGKRAQELHSSHKSGRIAGVYDKIVTRIIT